MVLDFSPTFHLSGRVGKTGPLNRGVFVSTLTQKTRVFSPHLEAHTGTPPHWQDLLRQAWGETKWVVLVWG